jgi:hypothetical protein
MQRDSDNARVDETKNGTETANLGPKREANEVVALTLSIIRTPFGKMMGTRPRLSGDADPSAA